MEAAGYAFSIDAARAANAARAREMGTPGLSLPFTVKDRRSRPSRTSAAFTQPWTHHHRHVKGGMHPLVDAAEMLRRHVDHSKGDPAHAHLASHNAAIRPELLLPEIVTENDYRVPAGHLILVGPERASQLQRL
jgi:hypothetical protein